MAIFPYYSSRYSINLFFLYPWRFERAANTTVISIICKNLTNWKLKPPRLHNNSAEFAQTNHYGIRSTRYLMLYWKFLKIRLEWSYDTKRFHILETFQIINFLSVTRLLRWAFWFALVEFHVLSLISPHNHFEFDFY